MSNQVINAMTLKSSAIYNQSSLRDVLLNPISNHIILKKKQKLQRLIQTSFNPKSYAHNCGDVFFNCTGVV